MLDTDISSYSMKRSDQALLTRLQSEPVGDAWISVITKSEPLFGMEISPRAHENRKALNDYLAAVEVLEFRDDAAFHYAQIRAHLRVRGIMIGPNDLFIAAHARSLEMTVVSNNTREFARVPDLKLEN